MLKENGFCSSSFWNTQQETGISSSTADSTGFQPSLCALQLLSTLLPDSCKKKKSSHCYWEYCHETEKMMENMTPSGSRITCRSRLCPNANVQTAAGYLLAWERQLQVQEEREDSSEMHASAKEEKQMTEECMKRNKNREIIETGGKQEHGKRNQLDLFKDCTWSHYRRWHFKSTFSTEITPAVDTNVLYSN